MASPNGKLEPAATISVSELRLLREFLRISASDSASGTSGIEMLLTSLALVLGATRQKC